MKLQKFISDEIGAITVDWVVLTALVVGLGGVTVLALGGTKEDGIADGAKAIIQNVPVKLSE